MTSGLRPHRPQLVSTEGSSRVQRLQNPTPGKGKGGHCLATARGKAPYGIRPAERESILSAPCSQIPAPRETQSGGAEVRTGKGAAVVAPPFWVPGHLGGDPGGPTLLGGVAAPHTQVPQVLLTHLELDPAGRNAPYGPAPRRQRAHVRRAGTETGAARRRGARERRETRSGWKQAPPALGRCLFRTARDARPGRGFLKSVPTPQHRSPHRNCEERIEEWRRVHLTSHPNLS